MAQSEIDILNTALREYWSYPPGKKSSRYVGQFFERTRTGTKIAAKVEGNYGEYTVSISVRDHEVRSACSCYIGGSGDCHHCHALAVTFLQEPESFQQIEPTTRHKVKTLDELHSYLTGVTLEALLKELKSHGITQKAFAESIGMNPRHLGSVKNSELRNRYYHELGATKLACLWVLEHISR